MLREATAVIVKLLTRSGVGAGDRVGGHASRSIGPRICSNRFGVKGLWCKPVRLDTPGAAEVVSAAGRDAPARSTLTPEEEPMRSIAPFAVLAATLFVVGCAHQINITPPLNTLEAKEVRKIDKTVGYHITAADLAKEVTTPGGGGDKVKYSPYQESEPALKYILSNVFTKVVPVTRLDDRQFLATNNVTYVFVPSIETTSSSESAFTWPPTRFTVTLDCRALDASGATVWQKKVKGEGQAEFDEFKHDFSLAARRASKEAFLNLQSEINAAKEFQ
jgi:hypothetical protein